ncbi:hypothetical protein AcW1_003616 [Taiwanofungus camphoratus]|nr:hypothetical protein AcW1_003616 [Antrodia cinnamomea]
MLPPAKCCQRRPILVHRAPLGNASSVKRHSGFGDLLQHYLGHILTLYSDHRADGRKAICRKCYLTSSQCSSSKSLGQSNLVIVHLQISSGKMQVTMDLLHSQSIALHSATDLVVVAVASGATPIFPDVRHTGLTAFCEPRSETLVL